MKTNIIHTGNCLDVMRTFPDVSVDCIITSPPYYQLRHYEGVPDYIWGGDTNCAHDWTVFESHLQHENRNELGGKGARATILGKHEHEQAVCRCGAWRGQLGCEPEFELYLQHMWEIVDECYRILKPSGTCWINLGDTYSGSGGFGYKQSIARVNQSTGGETKNMRKITGRVDTLPNKSLILIPHRFAIGCSERGWIVRNDIIWQKPNGLPESATDRFSKKHEHLFFMVKSQRYFFDLDAIRDKHKTNSIERTRHKWSGQRELGSSWGGMDITKMCHQEGKNPGDVASMWDIPDESDVWNLNTKGSKDEHYASFNFALIEKPIAAGCPEFVCKKCGKAREKIIESEVELGVAKHKKYADHLGLGDSSLFKNRNKRATKTYKGLSDCGCDAGFEGGVVVDPFCGTGTTGVRAMQLGRRFIGIEGSTKYTAIGNRNLDRERLQYKMF